jgi:predicted tellurium resistance membrane protein TerC
VIVTWVAINLFIEFGNERGWIVLHVPTVLSVGIVFAILAKAAAYSGAVAPVKDRRSTPN